MKKLINVLFITVVGLGAVVWGPAWAAASELPQELVKDTSQQMIQALRKNRQTLNKDPSGIYDLVDEIVLPHFDFKTISRWVLGKYWRRATPEQRNSFTLEFRTLLVRTYAKALLEYSNEEIHFPPVPAPSKNADDVTVRSEVQPSSGPTIPINYSLHLRGKAWKVYDVTVDGISLVANYRGSLAGEIRKQGMDAMIAKLRDRNRQAGS